MNHSSGSPQLEEITSQRGFSAEFAINEVVSCFLAQQVQARHFKKDP